MYDETYYAMAKKNNVLLILALVLLFLIIIFVFRNISGLVTSDVAAKLEVNRHVLEFNRYDNSNVVNVAVDTGSDSIGTMLSFKSAKDGIVIDRLSLCDRDTCEGKLSKNFVIKSSIESGEYYFEIDRICQPTHSACESLHQKIKSGILEIKHV
mgnify:CR=1 FL=1